MELEVGQLLSINCPNEDENGNQIFYPQIYQLRVHQIKLQSLPTNLTNVKRGLVELHKCHHISTSVASVGMLESKEKSFRVRICKTCCQNEHGHIELGTYIDQESAILVNDVHEILQERYDKLILLVPQDKPFLHLLFAKKYDRHKGRGNTSILKIIEERKLNQTMSTLPSHRLMTSAGKDLKLKSKDLLVSKSDDEICSNTTRFSPSLSSKDNENDNEMASCPYSTDEVEDEQQIPDEEGATSPESTFFSPYSKPLRARAMTFSAMDNIPLKHALSPMSALTFFAGLKDEEMSAAKLLTELCSVDGNFYDKSKMNSKEPLNRLKEIKTSMGTSGTSSTRERSHSLPFMYNTSHPCNLNSSRRSRADSVGLSELVGLGYIGIYSPEERKKRILRFLDKRKRRVWVKKVKYDVRKNFADSRIRVKGRFVRKDEEEFLGIVMDNDHDRDIEENDAEDIDEEEDIDECVKPSASRVVS